MNKCNMVEISNRIHGDFSLGGDRGTVIVKIPNRLHGDFPMGREKGVLCKWKSQILSMEIFQWGRRKGVLFFRFLSILHRYNSQGGLHYLSNDCIMFCFDIHVFVLFTYLKSWHL